MRGWTHTHAHSSTQGHRSHRPSHPLTLLSSDLQSKPRKQLTRPDIRGRQGGKEFTVRNQQETMGEGNLEAIRGKFEVD